MNPWHMLLAIVVVLSLGLLNALALGRSQTNYYIPVCLEVPLR